MSQKDEKDEIDLDEYCCENEKCEKLKEQRKKLMDEFYLHFADLNKKMGILLDDMRQLKNDGKGSEKKINELQDQQKKHLKHIATIQNKNNQKQRQCKKQSKIIKQLKQKNNKQQNQIYQLQKRNAKEKDNQNIIHKLKKKIDGISKDLEKETSEKTKSINYCSLIQAQLVQTEYKLDRRTDQLLKKQATINRLKKTNINKEEDIKFMKRKAKHIEKQLQDTKANDESNKDVMAHQAKLIHTQKRNISELTHKLEQQQDDIEQQQDDIIQLQHINAIFQKQVEHFATDNQKLQTDINEKTETIKGLTTWYICSSTFIQRTGGYFNEAIELDNRFFTEIDRLKNKCFTLTKGQIYDAIETLAKKYMKQKIGLKSSFFGDNTDMFHIH